MALGSFTQLKQCEIFQEAKIVYTESGPINKTTTEFIDECCRVADDSTVTELLPGYLQHHYASLVNMLPVEFHRRHPDLSKRNPYCVALDVHLLRKAPEVYKLEYDQIATLDVDTFIGLEAKSKDKAWRFIEQPPCRPLSRMPLVKVSKNSIALKGRGLLIFFISRQYMSWTGLSRIMIPVSFLILETSIVLLSWQACTFTESHAPLMNVFR